jgi:hypothetical protein
MSGAMARCDTRESVTSNRASLASHRSIPLEQESDANTNINCYGTGEKLPETYLLCTRFRIRDGDELRSARHQLHLDAGAERQKREASSQRYGQSVQLCEAGYYPMLFEGKTDSAGGIRFCLGDSTPAELIYSFGKHFYKCSGSEIETAVLLEHGLVDRRDQCGRVKLKYNGQPRPAELVVFAQPWSLEERIFGQFP